MDQTAAAIEHRLRRQNYMLRVWRLGNMLARSRVPVLPQLVRVLCQVIFHADVPPQARISRGVVFMHNGLGTVVHSRVEFRGPAVVFHNVTIGNRHIADEGVPRIGRRVFIGAGAVIVGDIDVGENCVIGANAVVTASVPAGHMAVGNPARIYPCREGLIDAIFAAPEAAAGALAATRSGQTQMARSTTSFPDHVQSSDRGAAA
jgi:serine O-acetyltransferase